MATQDIIRSNSPLTMKGLAGLLILNVGQNLIWGGLSLLTLWITREFPLYSRPNLLHWMAHLVASAVVVSVGMIAIAGMAFLYSPPRGPIVEAFLQFARRFISFSYLVCYWGVVGLHEGFQILKGSHEKDLQVSLLESQLSETQLQALKVQLNPHFLFNSLNTLSALIHSDPAKGDRMLIKLSHFLRISLEKTREEFTTLGQEISLMEDYLDIERVRFGDQLQFSIEVPEGLREALVPAFILQPLLENAIKHGIAGRLSGGKIHLRAHQMDRMLVIDVRDNGLGDRGGSDPAKGTNIGLRITRTRLQRHYGLDQSFSLQFPEEGGALARISLPLQVDSEPPLMQKRLPSGFSPGLARLGVLHE
jgi:hypothetical protein